MNELKNAYLSLQILADTSVEWALATDFLRARMRDEISEKSGKSSEKVQNECEDASYHTRCFG